MEQKIELTTVRLVIRTPEERDVKDIFTLMNNQEIAASTGFRPMGTPSEAEGKIRRGIANLQMFAIAERVNPGRVIGVFEFCPHVTATASGEKSDYHICYFLHSEARKKGFMTETVERMKAYLFNDRAADTLTISVYPRNDASRRVALKSGFTYAGLEKRCGVTHRNELVDLEYYTLDREEYFNPGKRTDKETVRTAERQKWINDGGILYPIPGSASLLPCPESGIFRIYEDPRNKRLGLEKVDEAFTFSFKIYDLDCEDIMSRVIRTWTSDLFTEGNKNLGVIFNGLKGTGKTIAAKLLSNRTGLPVIVISKPAERLLEFVQSLCFESVILIDEAEKTFSEEPEVLLKMIDGVYNNRRKLYILTTNKLNVDENLLGRPGRIRYIKEFGNLSPKALNDIIDDNLKDASLKEGILRLVDTLEISTIDILKSIIDECNITGEVPSGNMLNIPKAKFRIRVINFSDLDSRLLKEVQEFIKSRLSPGQTVEEWLMSCGGGAGGDKAGRNKETIEEKYGCSIEIQTLPSASPTPHTGQQIRHMTVTSEPDEYGFFTTEYEWYDPELCCLAGKAERPSLYRGTLL